MHTPIPPTLQAFEGTASSSQIHEYQQRVGSIGFPAVYTRPDCARPSSKLAQFLVNPSPEHRQAATQCIEYLLSAKNLALEFDGKGHLTQRMKAFLAYSDAAFADNVDTRHSIKLVALSSAICSKILFPNILLCRRCKVLFAFRKMLHQHLATCGKQEQHCRCAAVEHELQSIKALLEELLTSTQQHSKLGRPASLELKPLKDLVILDNEDSVDYIRRHKSVFSALPVRLQYQQNTRWQLYEHLGAFMPEFYEKERE